MPEEYQLKFADEEALPWSVRRQAQTILIPIAARRQFNDRPDALWTKISIDFNEDATDAVFKLLVE